MIQSTIRVCLAVAAVTALSIAGQDVNSKPGAGATASLAAPKSGSTPKSAAATAKPDSPVDSVIELVKSGMSEGLIVRTLQKQSKPVDLAPADPVKLKNAQVSERIIAALMDPASVPAAAPA